MKLQISHELWDKIFFFTERSPVEISFMGRVKVNKDGFILKSIYLVEQYNHAAETEMNANDLAKLMYKTKDDEGDLNCWIHSHGHMGVHWSGQDTKQIKQMGSNGYIIAMVVNKKEETKCSYYQGADGFKPAVYIDSVEVKRVYNTAEDIKKQWEKEFTEKCKPPKSPVIAETNIWGSWHNGEWVSNVNRINNAVNTPSDSLIINTRVGGKRNKMMKKAKLLSQSRVPVALEDLLWKEYSIIYGARPATVKDLNIFYDYWCDKQKDDDKVIDLVDDGNNPLPEDVQQLSFRDDNNSYLNNY